MNELLKDKKFLSIYSLWILLQTTFLLISDKDGTRFFWPCTKNSLTVAYDLSEWFFYLATPLVIIFIIKSFEKK